MEWLNYHHLFYFWHVAREGGVRRACDKLLLAQPTISGQIAMLEKSLGEKLFARSGRTLALTETGLLVYRYADEIFSLGRELQDALRGRPTGRPLRLAVGAADALPKLMVHRLLEPAFNLSQAVLVSCHEDKPERLLQDLATHSLDLVLSDAPPSPMVKVRVFSHLLGECGITFFAAPAIAAKYRRGFPQRLAAAPLLLPPAHTSLRRALDQWFDERGIRPNLAGEFEDSALLKTFGQSGLGVFPAPSVVEKQVQRQYKVRVVGRVPEVRERFYAISAERRLKHPVATALVQSARERLFTDDQA